MKVRTRFAPSPTGFLHIGGVRTAIFNWLFARHYQGKFHLRIEDTDTARSSQDAVEAILQGMKWMGLDWDGEVIYQSMRADRHRQVAHHLLETGHAYRCYMSQDDLDLLRQQSRGNPTTGFRSPWRDSTHALDDAPYTIRLKVPLEGETKIEDITQGDVVIKNKQIDDMILLRSDGTPTYMLSVVVDDYDMGITHVIRGDDHLTNSFRQKHIYDALDWDVPQFCHIPLIHGHDGAKLSKRHGALGVEAYAEMGILPEALFNYMLRLGWAHGDDEIIPRKQAILWFDGKGMGKSASRFDPVKLQALNAHYLRQAENSDLYPQIQSILKHRGFEVTHHQENWIFSSMDEFKQRSRTLVELADQAEIYVKPLPFPRDEKNQKLFPPEIVAGLRLYAQELHTQTAWEESALEHFTRDFCTAHNFKMGKIAQPLRVMLTGRTVSPSVFHMMVTLGQEETFTRIDSFFRHLPTQDTAPS